MPLEAKKKKNSLLKKLKNKYHLVIMNDDTFEEKVSFKLTKLNVFIAIGATIIILIVITSYVIAFTPLREYIPGYGSRESNRNIRDLMLKADSMQEDLQNKELYLYNIKNIIEGKDVVEKLPEKPESTSTKYNNLSFSKSLEDSMLRLEMEKQEQYNIAVNNSYSGSINTYISNFFFFTPLKGMITNNFNPIDDHFGVDIVAAKNEAIKATLDGTVVFAGWTLKTGYTLVIQHSDNLVSVYKHNSALLKNDGAYVKAGEVVAIIGESGELTNGQHLHFELWYNGKAVNPRDYMVF